MVLGLRMAAPAGDMTLEAMPASAAGPGLRELIVGSEGTLGVIDEVSLRVRAAPAQRIYEGVMFESFAAGLQALRAMAQEHATPDVARLSDAAETRMSMTLAGTGGLKGRLGRAYLGARGYGDGQAQRCIAILGFEGDSARGRTRRGRAIALARAQRRPALGGSPGRGVAGGTVSGAVPARRAADVRRDGRDAGDGDALVERGVAARRGDAARSSARCRRRGRPGWSCATSRTCMRRAPRCTSRSSPVSATAPRSSSGGRSSMRRARRS